MEDSSFRGKYLCDMERKLLRCEPARLFLSDVSPPSVAATTCRLPATCLWCCEGNGDLRSHLYVGWKQISKVLCNCSNKLGRKPQRFEATSHSECPAEGGRETQ